MRTREVVLQGEEAEAYLVQKRSEAPGPLTAEDYIYDAAKPSKQELQQSLVVQKLTEKYDIIRVVSSEPTYYYRDKHSPSYTYERLYEQQAKNMVRDLYLSLKLIPTAKKVDETVKTVETMVQRESDSLNNVLELAPGLYWDTALPEPLAEKPLRPCFRRLFDNANYHGPATIQVDLTNSLYGDMVRAEIKSVYRGALKWLEMLSGTFPPMDEYEASGGVGDKSLPILATFPFIYTWACDDHDLYMDMLKAACTIFMKNKPKKVFALTGLKRNGKSTYLSLLHTLLGRANTSSLRLAELSDYHMTEQLRFTMMNAPDEESSISEMTAKDIANFKSLATHDPIFVSKMYQSNATYINSDFPCFMAWNQDPKWKGSGAAACAERTIILPFNADLSKFDTSGGDFKKETFTADMYADLIGVLLALAHYYDNHKMTFSDATMAETKEVSEDTNAPIEYAKLFVKWYCGFDKQTTVFDDFAAWCSRNGYGYQGITTKDVVFAIKKIGGVPNRTNVSIGGTPTPVQRLPRAIGRTFLAGGQYIPELKKTVGEILWIGENQTTGNSVTDGLENWLAMSQIPKTEREEPKRDYQSEIAAWRETN